MPISLPIPLDLDARLTVDPDSGSPDEERLFRAVGLAGAVRRDRLEIEFGSAALTEILDRGFLRVVHPLYGPVVTLSPEGYDIYAELTGHRAERLTRPSTLADRAFQVEAILHLRGTATVVGRQLKRASGLASLEDRTHTDQVVAYRVVLEGTPQARWAEQGQVAEENLRYCPLLYCRGASGPVTMETVRHLMKTHRGDVTLWGHGPLLLVPHQTPELERGMATLRARIGGSVSRVAVPTVEVVPPVRAPSAPGAP